MTRQPVVTPDGVVVVSSRHLAWSAVVPAWADPPEQGHGPWSLHSVHLPSSLVYPYQLAGAYVLDGIKAALLGYVARHPGTPYSAAVAALRPRYSEADARPAYDRLVTDGLILPSEFRKFGAQRITNAGVDALTRAQVAEWNRAHDMAAYDQSWEHPANWSQRWAVACHTGMLLVGLPYVEDEAPEACLLAAWDMMSEAARQYLTWASMPLLLGLRVLAESDPVTLESAVAGIRQWARWCGKPPRVWTAVYVARQLRKAASAGLVQIIGDPSPPDGQSAGQLIGPVRAWTVPGLDLEGRPVLHLVDG